MSWFARGEPTIPFRATPSSASSTSFSFASPLTRLKSIFAPSSSGTNKDEPVTFYRDGAPSPVDITLTPEFVEGLAARPAAKERHYTEKQVQEAIGDAKKRWDEIHHRSKVLSEEHDANALRRKVDILQDTVQRRDTLPTPQELQDLKKELETCYLYSFLLHPCQQCHQLIRSYDIRKHQDQPLQCGDLARRLRFQVDKILVERTKIL